MVRRTKELAQETRMRILDAAEVVFQRDGASKTSLADIAFEAGVTRGAIYWHFRNKLDMFDAMVQRALEPVASSLTQFQEQAGDDALESVRELVLYFLGRVAGDARVHRVIEIAWHKCEYVGEMARVRDMRMACGRRYLGSIEAAMRASLQRGQLRASVDPHQAAVGLMALVDGLIVNWTLDRSAFALARIAPGIVDAYLAGLRSGRTVATPTRDAAFAAAP